MRDFLKTKIKSQVPETLYKGGFDGQMLLTWTKQDYQELDEEPKLKSAEVVMVIKTKNEFIDGKADLPKKATTTTTERQKTRSFWKPWDLNNKYKIGNFIPPESGPSSIEEPAREFKLFSLDKKRLEEVETSFVDKVAKFAAACLNSRINGTIYFGVGDNRDGHKHGEIVGMNVKEENECNMIEEWIEKHLRGTNQKYLMYCKNEEKRAFSRCISTVKVIQIEDSSKVIVEIDIKPEADICKYLVFPIHFPEGGDVKTAKYFYREGTSSCQGRLLDERNVIYFIPFFQFLRNS